ncbi:MAG: AAA family ATPase [Gammaproteobacteria bacterium]
MSCIEYFNFGNFYVDIPGGRMSKNRQPLALTPKSFELLLFLCRNSGRLILKQELLDAVWKRQYVSEGVLKNAIRELRQALGDDPKSPRYIETVHRRGYRFIAALRHDSQDDHEIANAAANDPSVLIVGRERLLIKLAQLLQQASAGQSESVFLSGEPGIGKTTLIKAFIRQSGSKALCVLGQCVEQYGPVEPYLALLEAINQLNKQGGEACVRMLRRFAPTWLAQLPWLIAENDHTRVQRETQGASKERMLRELGEFLRAWTEYRPVVMVIEDIHWSDRATLDAINYLARRKDGCRLMVLGSYRSTDVVFSNHAFANIRNELLLHGLCRDLMLTPLSGEDVGCYLRRRFPQNAVSDATCKAVYQRTEGLPLFLARVADAFDINEDNGTRSLSVLPVGLKHLVDIQFERLSVTEKHWLEIAAVCGDNFTAETLACIANTSPVDLEQWCERLVRGGLLRHANAKAQSTRLYVPVYAFVHAYYQERIYERIAPSKKTLLHRQVGDQLKSRTVSMRHSRPPNWHGILS